MNMAQDERSLQTLNPPTPPTWKGDPNVLLMHQEQAGRMGGEEMTQTHCSARPQVPQQ